MPRGVPNTNQDENTSPVQPVESSTVAPDVSSEEVPSVTSEPSVYPGLQEALERAEAAEARAKAAEEAATKAQEALQASQKAQTQTVASADIPTAVGTQNDFYDKDGNELCWNCVNHGEKNKLNVYGSCLKCGFEKNKLYNGNIEATKAAERLAAERQGQA